MKKHLLNPGLPRRLTSANRYGSLLAKTGNDAIVVYKKDGFLARRCEEPSTIPPFLRKGGMVLGDEAIQCFAIRQKKDTPIVTTP